MKTISDLVLKHCDDARKCNDTSTALEMLELEHKPENYGVANTYASALDIIIKLQDRIKELESKNEY